MMFPSLRKTAILQLRLLLLGRLRRIWRTTGSPLSASPLRVSGSRQSVSALTFPASFAVGVRRIPASAPSVATPAFMQPSTSFQRIQSRFWISPSRPWRRPLLRLMRFRMHLRISTSLCVISPLFRRILLGLRFARMRRNLSPTTRFCLFATPLVASPMCMVVPRRPFVPASFAMPTPRFSRFCDRRLLLPSISSGIRLRRFLHP